MATSPAAPDSAAGRRLRAGVYLDRALRDRALRHVYNARGRRVAPSHGYDVVPVLRHAWRAWFLENGQYLLTLAVLATGLAVAPLDTLIAVDMLVIWCLLRLWARWTAQYIGYGEPVDSPALDQVNLTRDRRLRLNGKVLKYSLWFSAAMLPALMLMSLLEGREGPASARLAGTGLGVAAVILAFAAVVVLGIGTHAVCLARSQSTPAWPGRLSRRMRAVDRQQHHPIIVHTGHEPFVGSGKRMRSWSFAQRLVHADGAVNGKGREFDRPPFLARELIDRLQDSILRLRADKDPETMLPGLSVTDEVFVHEAHAAPFREALESDADSDTVSRAVVGAIANPGDAARHYLAARVESWGGDIVTSVFVHVSLQGRTLYLEFATYALFPVKVDDYEMSRMGSWAIAADVCTALARLPERLLESWRLIQAPASFMPARPRADADAEPEACLREIAMADNDAKSWDEPESGYFQVQDVAQHSKIIERRLLAAVEEFLGEVGVDTSEFAQRTMQILNSGILNIGGEVSVANSAVGENSSVNS